jgi:hypothetical protein
VVTLAFKKKIVDQVLAWKSGVKVPLLPRVPPFPLQPILLGDLVSVKQPAAVYIMNSFFICPSVISLSAADYDFGALIFEFESAGLGLLRLLPTKTGGCLLQQEHLCPLMICHALDQRSPFRINHGNYI